MRNKQETAKMKKAFRAMDVTVIPINERISLQAAEYVENYALSNAIELADALIAATCVQKKDILLTANDKHYKAITELQFSIFRP